MKCIFFRIGPLERETLSRATRGVNAWNRIGYKGALKGIPVHSAGVWFFLSLFGRGSTGMSSWFVGWLACGLVDTPRKKGRTFAAERSDGFGEKESSVCTADLTKQASERCKTRGN